MSLKMRMTLVPTLQVYLEDEIMPSAFGTQQMLAKH